MRLIPTWIILFLTLALLPGEGEAQDHTIVVWNGRTSNLDIHPKQLEPLVAAPTYQRYSGEGNRAPLQWFRLRIENRGSAPERLYLRSLDPATHMLVLIEQPAAYTGALPREQIMRRNQIPESTWHFARIEIQLDPGFHTYYLGTSSYLGMQNFQLTHPLQADIEDSQFTLFAGFMLGCIVLMMASALLLFAGASHRILLFYALYTFALLPLLLNVSGLTGLVASPDATDWLERHLSLTAQLAVLGLMELSLAILDLKRLKPRIYVLLRSQSALALVFVLIAIGMATDRSLLGITQATSAIAILCLLTIGIRLSWQDIRPARFYIAGLGAFLLGSLVILVASFEINVAPFEPILCFMAGAVAQSILLPFGIRDHLQTALAERSQQEDQLKEARSLIFILTHDLSGPLFVIQSMAELQEGKAVLDPKIRQSFEKIRLAAQSAQAMLKVVKELEAIEAGKVELVLKPVPLMPTLQGTVDILRPRAEAKQVRIELHGSMPDEDLRKLMVLGERTVLENTIFYNLVVNAIKFSKPDDTIQLLIEALDDDRVAIRVRDRGIGIPKTLIVNLFSHSGKTNRRGTAGEKGTGLGLPLARRYAQKFGGNIEVQSQAQEEFPDDHWTQFTVTLKKAG